MASGINRAEFNTALLIPDAIVDRRQTDNVVFNAIITLLYEHNYVKQWKSPVWARLPHLGNVRATEMQHASYKKKLKSAWLKVHAWKWQIQWDTAAHVVCDMTQRSYIHRSYIVTVSINFGPLHVGSYDSLFAHLITREEGLPPGEANVKYEICLKPQMLSERKQFYGSTEKHDPLSRCIL